VPSVSAGEGAVRGFKIELSGMGEVRLAGEEAPFSCLCELPSPLRPPPAALLAAFLVRPLRPIAPAACRGPKAPCPPIEVCVPVIDLVPCVLPAAVLNPPISGVAVTPVKRAGAPAGSEFIALDAAGLAAATLNDVPSRHTPPACLPSGMLPFPAVQLEPPPGFAARGAGFLAVPETARQLLDPPVELCVSCACCGRCACCDHAGTKQPATTAIANALFNAEALIP
jgi:hypothetical protein